LWGKNSLFCEKFPENQVNPKNLELDLGPKSPKRVALWGDLMGESWPIYLVLGQVLVGKEVVYEAEELERPLMPEGQKWKVRLINRAGPQPGQPFSL